MPKFHEDVGRLESDPRISDILLEWMPSNAGSKGPKLRPCWRESLNPDHSRDLERSDKHLCGLLAKDCPVPDGARLHNSVIRRMEHPRARYRPGNLPNSYVEVS